MKVRVERACVMWLIRVERASSSREYHASRRGESSVACVSALTCWWQGDDERGRGDERRRGREEQERQEFDDDELLALELEEAQASTLVSG